MQRCLQLAEMGRYTCSPNPMVGSVLVYQDRIIAEGWHHKAGEAHAERKALLQVEDETLLQNSTLYVSLEPCSHYGRTPPCASLIVEKKIPKVVVASLDSNPLVAGKGLEMLRQHGIEVISGVLEQEARELNKKFYTYHEKKRPYILLKWAQSADGFIASIKEGNPKPLAISNAFSNRKVHLLRAEYDAILVGSNTAITDNPKLDVRHVKGKNPLRILIDRNLKTPKDHHLIEGKQTTWILNQQREGDFNNKYYKKYPMENWDWLEDFLKDLHQAQIQSLMVEGGREVLQAFIDKNLWDEAQLISNPKLFLSEGVKSPVIAKNLLFYKEKILGDNWEFFKNE